MLLMRNTSAFTRRLGKFSMHSPFPILEASSLGIRHLTGGAALKRPVRSLCLSFCHVFCAVPSTYTFWRKGVLSKWIFETASQVSVFWIAQDLNFNIETCLVRLADACQWCGIVIPMVERRT